MLVNMLSTQHRYGMVSDTRQNMMVTFPRLYKEDPTAVSLRDYVFFFFFFFGGGGGGWASF